MSHTQHASRLSKFLHPLRPPGGWWAPLKADQFSATRAGTIMNIGWLFILMAAIYFLLTVVLRVGWLRGRWSGNQVPVSTKSNIAWSICVTTWSLPFLIPQVKGHVAPLALLGMILGFCIVFTFGCFDAREAKKKSRKRIKSSTAPDGTHID
jgi:hypothetical protein